MEASALPPMAMVSTASHCRAESKESAVRWAKRRGKTISTSTKCSARTMKVLESSFVRCKRKGASVAHSIAARKMRYGP
jgi:hypothetical protein